MQDGDGEDYSEILSRFSDLGLVIEVINLEENVGPGLARQAAMDADHTSKYFMFCDSDDLYMPQAIESLHRGAEEHNCDIITSSFIRHGEKDNKLQDVSNTAITWCAGKIYLAEYLRKNNIRFHPNLRVNEDSYFNVVAWNSTPKRGQLNEVTVLMMDNPESLTRKDGAKGFLKKGWVSYIISQVDGLREIYKQTLHLDARIAARTLVYLYNESMIALYYDCDPTDAKYYLKKLNVAWFKKLMDEVAFWDEVQSTLRGSELYENDLIFFDLNFAEWLKWILEK